MVWIVGTVHPPPCQSFTEAMPTGYGLTKDVLDTLVRRMIGLPITIEHTGIFSAIATMAQDQTDPTPAAVTKYLHSNPGIETSPVGMVYDCFFGANGWLYIAALIDQSLEAVDYLIRAELLRGLSLTHIDSVSVPLEVSLCYEPARPGCHVKIVSNGLQRAVAYKRAVISGEAEPDRIMSEIEKTMLEKVMEALPEDQRTVIAARLTEMVQRCDEEKTRADAAEQKATVASAESEKQLAAAKQTADHNANLLKSQLDILRANLDSSTVENFNVSEAHTTPLFDSTDPHAIRRTVDRLLCAANHQLMSQKAALSSQPVVSRKREREDDSEAQAAPTVSARDHLSRAMASTFTL